MNCSLMTQFLYCDAPHKLINNLFDLGTCLEQVQLLRIWDKFFEEGGDVTFV